MSRSCAECWRDEYPGVTFYVLPVDIVTQILNFGLSAPIDIQIVGPNLYGNRAVAEKMLNDVRYVPGASDARIQQPFDYPNLTVNVDRTRAQAIGLTQRDVAQSLLVALSGSFQTTPSFYLDPRNGVSYNVAVQTPQYRLDSMSALQSLPVTAVSNIAQRSWHADPGDAPARRTTNGARARRSAVQVLGNLAQYRAGRGTGHGEPLRRAAGARHLRQRRRHRPRHRDARDGQDRREVREGAAARFAHSFCADRARRCSKSYIGLLGGLAFSILLVYLLIVVNFQSWLDPFLIISALPAALAGIAWFLFPDRTRG